jgi:hypothetical protein
MPVDPIFFDNTGRRWRIAKCLLIVFAIGILSLPTAFVITAFTLEPGPGVATNLDPPSGSEKTFQFGRVASKLRAQ